MRGMIAFVYGLLAYAAGCAALLYFFGFSANLAVPRSVDVGSAAPWPVALGVDLLLLALFGLQHSLMARSGFKRWWTRLVPTAVERSTYVVATTGMLALLFWLWLPIPAPLLWRFDGIAAGLLWGAFGLGCALVLGSSFLINHFELFGLQQVHARLLRRPMPAAQFRTPLLYRQVRHPLYAGLLLTLWAVPVMSIGRALFAFGLSVYILIGIAFEERDLVRQFGERYRSYQRHVAMLIPHPAVARSRIGTGEQPSTHSGQR